MDEFDIKPVNTLKRVLKENTNEFDLRKYLGAGKNCICQTIRNKIKEIFLSNNKL